MVKDGDAISKGMVVAEWDPYLNPIIAEADGEVVFKDLISNVSYTEILDHSTGINRAIVKNSRFLPSLILKTASGNINYSLIPNDAIMIEEGAKVVAGTLIAQRPQNITKTQDIVGGLPLIFDLLEARASKQAASVAEISGKVSIINNGSTVKISIVNDISKHEINVLNTSRIFVEDGDIVEPGDLLTDGRPCPHDILRTKGPEAMSRYLTDEIQSVYQGQGITIADKHIEIILRQMLGSVVVLNPGDSTLLKGDVVRSEQISRVNLILAEMGKGQITFSPHLNGISKAAVLEKTSFFAAASFQETAKCLVAAAVNNEIDCLRGMKESIMTGKLMPVGCGGLIREVNMETQAALEKCVLDVAARDMIV
jgi:DNA-directed RNA polymerase subunit beta'